GGAREGNMVPATLMENVPHDCDLYRQEVFGPVACLQPFDDFNEALDTVNSSEFGLQTGVFTASLAHAMKAWDRLEVGGVIIGDVPSFRVDNMPYGGVKQSGLGREGVRYAIEDMAEPRLLVIRDQAGNCPLCLVAVAWRAHPRWPLALIANRDELHARPTAAAGFDPDAPDVYGGRDLVQGGGW